MKQSGWGRFPIIEATVSAPWMVQNAKSWLTECDALIARGLGRSYGDSSLSPNILCTEHCDHFLEFDSKSGRLKCESGTSLDTILEIAVPQGWFLPVTPGTKYVSVGGAIAGDVHGKNHHRDGCFSEFCSSFSLLAGDGLIYECSRENHSDLFHATCGGIGLTGIILDATLQLKRIKSSQIRKTTYKAKNLMEAINLFEENNDVAYSVAWIDCHSKRRNLGRSIVIFGEHDESGALITNNRKTITIPFEMPSFLMNRFTVSIFNSFYYRISSRSKRQKLVHYEPFFYPLDRLKCWNRLYGKNGFIQYQFVLPRESGPKGITRILERISSSGKGSFLAVLKLFGTENDNYLSFPLSGYTLALDFKIEPGLFYLLDQLDAMVL